MEHIHHPRQIGDILRQLFIIRPDGTVDHDLVIAYARALRQKPHPDAHPCAETTNKLKNL